ncbi:hypothetical protein P8452_13542 [Trifolium repens]|nr:hypothetical protein P8452_13542 [Trifolium repens]
MCDDKKICYLAPYFNNHHWQLLIINPTKLEVVFLCSLGKSPDKKSMKFLTQLWQLIISYNVRESRRKWIGYFPLVKSKKLVMSAAISS